MPGPVPKRSDQRRHRNQVQEITSAQSGLISELEWIEPDSDWHDIAATWYTSLAQSGQSVFYEASDLATAYYAASLMSQILKSDRINGQLVTALNSLMDTLLTTEGARRKARVELQKPSEVDTSVADQMEAYRRAAG